MALARSTRFRVASNNLMSLPKNKNVGNAINATLTDDVIGFQEASPPDFKIKLKKKYPGIFGLGPIKDDRYASPLRMNGNKFKHLRKGTDKLYSGVAHVSLTRHMTWAIVQDKATGQKFGGINLHAVVVKKDKNYKKRLAMRVECKRVLKKRLKWMVDQGHPVVITGDFNDRANWLGASFEGQRVTRSVHRIDQIYFVDSKTSRWGKVGKTVVEDTTSDHHALSVTAILNKK